MADINTLPMGLLGFLGLKNGGNYPRGLRDDLHPTWDLEQLYASANSRFATAGTPVNAVGSQALFTVPQGEAWLLLEMSVASATLGAGQTIQLGLVMTDAAATVSVGIGQPGNAATVGQRGFVALGRSLYVPPGATVGAYVTQIAAGPVSLTGSVRYAPLLL